MTTLWYSALDVLASWWNVASGSALNALVFAAILLGAWHVAYRT